MIDGLVRRIHDSVLDDSRLISTPYFGRRITYADHSACARPLSFIEEFVQREVLPYYTNAVNDASGTARQTTIYREGARDIVRQAVGASHSWSVIFTGTDTAAAVSRLAQILFDPSISRSSLPGSDIRLPVRHPFDLRSSESIHDDDKPVVFLAPNEHAIDRSPWDRTLADVIIIPTDRTGGLDTVELEAQLKRFANRVMRVGCFSRASSISGVFHDTAAISALLKKYDALCVWNYSSAAPHVPMVTTDADAVVFSAQTFAGGNNTPGILAVRRSLLDKRATPLPFGGKTDHLARKFEGTSQRVVETIRAGLALQLHQQVGVKTISQREEAFKSRAMLSWSSDPSIEFVGDLSAARLPIIPFRIRRPKHRYLHHNFVIAVLSDVFGIEATGGCECRGVCGHRLLGIDSDQRRLYEQAFDEGLYGVKPGWVTVTFKYHMDDDAVGYIIRAVHLVSKHAWALLPQYDFSPMSGQWKHRKPPFEPPLRLTDLRYDAENGFDLVWPNGRHSAAAIDYDLYITTAQSLLQQEVTAVGDQMMESGNELRPIFEWLRWFDLPAVCLKAAIASGELETTPAFPRDTRPRSKSKSKQNGTGMFGTLRSKLAK